MLQMFPYYGLFAKVLSLVGDDWQGKQGDRGYTLAAVCSTSRRYTWMRLMQTVEPFRLPMCTSPKPPRVNGLGSISRFWGGRVYDVGSIALVPHTLLSSRRHFREVGQDGSRRLRAYSGLSGSVEGRYNDVPCLGSQQARLNYHVQGFLHIGYTPGCKVFRRVGPENRAKICRGDRAVAKLGKRAKT